jgi:hypothetical protein
MAARVAITAPDSDALAVIPNADGSINVNAAGSTTGAAAIATAQVSVANSATLIAAARTGPVGTGRVAITIENSGTTDVFIGCVRHVAWIMDSFERLVRRNCWELSGIFGFEPGGTVYSRCAALGASNGLVGFALDALRESFYGEHASRMLLVEYEALAKAPADAIAAIYRWLELPQYAHDFANIQQIPGAAEFDEKLGTRGLHSVRSSVDWEERQSVIPPELFNAYPAPFWRAPNPRATVISARSVQTEKPRMEVSA